MPTIAKLPPPISHHERKSGELLSRIAIICGGLGGLAAIIGIPLLIIQANSATQQANYIATQTAIQLAAPQLQAVATYRFPAGQDMGLAQQALIEQYFTLVEARHQSQPNVAYSEIMTNVLPITRSLPALPVLIVMNVSNKGTVAATGVNVALDVQGAIAEISSVSLSTWGIINGGKGTNSVVTSLERIAPGETATLTLSFEPTATTTLVLVAPDTKAPENTLLPHNR